MRYGSTVFVVSSIWSGVLMLSVLAPTSAAAGQFEISAAASYTSSNYSFNNYEWTRRYGLSFGYHFTETSEIEVSYEDVTDQTQLEGIESTNFHNEIYSLDWVQAFWGRNAPFQPYVKVGIGELNQQASGSYAEGVYPPAVLDSITGILGAGLRLYFTRSFALRGEFTTYLTNGDIDTWKGNISAQIGISFFF